MINRAFVLRPRLSRAAKGFAILILAAAGCGVAPASSDSTTPTTSSPTANPPSADDGNGDGNDNGNGGGGIAWPSLPDGPEIPQTLEIYVYRVLRAADSSRCAALFAPAGVEVDAEGGPYVVSLVGATEFSFVTGDRTRLLYEAAGRLCAGDEASAREAFVAAASLGSWSVAAEDTGTQTVVCTVWEAVVSLLDPSAGACTLQVASDNGSADATGGATPSGGPSATAVESPSSADDATGSDAAGATDAP